MIQRIWIACGQIVYYLSLPLLWLYLHGSQRTRVLVVCNDEILVVRAWLGNGLWGLPGGGMHKNELPEICAARELKEETGVDVNMTDLQFLFSGKSGQKYRPSFKMYAYVLELMDKPKISKQKFEITHAQWLTKQELLNSSNTENDMQTILVAFYKR